MNPKTPRERAEEKRQQKLDEVQRQIDAGGLTVRKLTDEEREKYPPLSEEEAEKRAKRKGGARR